jgi:PHP family Zn ribbon phosphoesterase
MWYKFALRKHQLRIDLHAHVGEVEDFNNENDLTSSIRSMLASAVYKGLDILGIISHEGPFMGQKAQQLVKQEGIDLYVVAGEEYLSLDKVRMIIFNLQDKMPHNMESAQAIAYAHQNMDLF